MLNYYCFSRDKSGKSDGGGGTSDDSAPKESSLTTLNLAHNSFSVVPRCLACLAPNLARLNLAYNSVAKVGAVSSYPNSLKHLDLSNNQIRGWPGDASNANATVCDNVCYAADIVDSLGTSGGGGSSKQQQQQQQQQTLVENKVLSRIHKLSVGGKNNACEHRSHSKLDNLRTLILASNLLEDINYYAAASESSGSDKEQQQSASSDEARLRILFPALSMLDVSENNIVAIPTSISDLSNLSVLNVSQNPRITDLPAQMGLLHK